MSLVEDPIEHGPCFHCGQMVTQGISWRGAEGTIQLHGECALHFAIRLMRDIHEFEIKYRRLVSSSVEGRID